MELNKIYCENCLDTMARMEDNCIDCCVTSPPYWGLRDYGTAKWEGGGDCDHLEENPEAFARRDGGRSETGTFHGSSKTNLAARHYKEVCGKCGAKRIDEQIGLEKTPEEYVSKMVEVFTEVKRVLKPEGTLWLNLGDSYAGGGRAGNNPEYFQKHQMFGKAGWDSGIFGKPQKVPAGLKAKDLVGIPWMTAFALRSSGWYLRQDIIWAKPNPMPESVTDRCTKSHEYIFLLTKSGKYYCDMESIKQEAHEDSFRLSKRIQKPHKHEQIGSDIVKGFGDFIQDPNGANKRSVWTVTTKPFAEAHFATFPEDLIKPMIIAGCPENGICYDPFMGAGTTALVAHKLDRKFIGSELNPDYVAIAEKRIAPYLNQTKLQFA